VDIWTKGINAPWRLISELRRWLIFPLARLAFAIHGLKWRKGWRIFGLPIIQRYRGSQISFGDRLALRSSYTSNPLAPNHPVVFATRSSDAVIQIGSDCGMTGATIVAANSIRIGDRVLIGANVTIVDTDFHALSGDARRQGCPPLSKPVMIEDDVFIGMNCIILKGVTIGHGSVIGAGSVVVNDIPPNMIAAGNPARLIRSVGV
jgi:acetyltransferase-like isoleucine patch superfamily enzyme